MKTGSTAMTQRPRDRVPSGSMLALPDPRSPDRANPPTNPSWSLFWQHWYDLHALGSHWTDSQHGILCWGFTGVQEEIPSEEANTLQIGSVASRQFLNLPIVQTLLPMNFAYSLSSEAIVMRQLRSWKRLWRRSLTCSHKRTSMGPCRSCWNGRTSALQPEEITSNMYIASRSPSTTYDKLTNLQYN